jgi:DNA modification methylase
MQKMDEASVDAIVTDPPYGLEFMGKEWDRLAPNDGRAELRPAEQHFNESADPNATIGAWKEGKRRPSGYAPKKNPRCRRCSRLKFDHASRKCQCEAPDWDTRTAEYARVMQQWHQAWATEALRVLKPGGHLLAFGGTRTYHRLACAIEDAGFEIRDSLIWLYGSGFPKSLDVSKAIDKASGAERTVTGEREHYCDAYPGRLHPTSLCSGRPKSRNGQVPGGIPEMHSVTAPATPEAQQWQGWGTALKPAHEPIVVARKPLIGTVVQNCLEHGTGAINVDGCRIGHDEPIRTLKAQDSTQTTYQQAGRYEDTTELKANGRWPANCALSHLPECERVGTRRVKGASDYNRAPESRGAEFWGMENPPDSATMGYADPDGTETIPAYSCAPGCPVAELDRQSGELKSPSPYMRNTDGRKMYEGGWDKWTPAENNYGDTGGASRFFYVAKASRAERNAGLDGFEERSAGVGDHRTSGDMNERLHRGEREHVIRRNNHPTVKPIDLMRWLVRLVTPPGGTVLDPFAGSGTTGIAATLEGFDFIGIEREPEYVEIARARIEHWQKYPEGTETKAALKQEAKERKRKEKEAQDGLF